jgi:integrase
VGIWHLVLGRDSRATWIALPPFRALRSSWARSVLLPVHSQLESAAADAKISAPAAPSSASSLVSRPMRASLFRNPMTKTRWVDMKKRFQRAVKAAEFHGLWFHGLRRSFITRARRVGVPESVVMRMSGHRTRAVFERYNVVDTQDLRAAVRALERLGKQRRKPKLRRPSSRPGLRRVAGAGFEPATFGL